MALGLAILWGTSSFEFANWRRELLLCLLQRSSLYLASSISFRLCLILHLWTNSFHFFISLSLSHFISDSFCTSGRCESTSYHFRPPVHDEFLHFALFILFALSPFHSTLPVVWIDSFKPPVHDASLFILFHILYFVSSLFHCTFSCVMNWFLIILSLQFAMNFSSFYFLFL